MTNPIKLNLGCGYDHKSGYINIDIDPVVKPDLILDLTYPLLPFDSGVVDHILMQDVLEHVTKEQALLLLKELFRVLKIDGQIQVRIPYLYPIMENFETDPEVMFEFIYGNTEHNGIWGVHKYGYTPETLKKTLASTGFTKIDVTEESTNLWATALKPKSLSNLNILVIQQSPDWGGAEEWMLTLTSKLHQFPNTKITAATNLDKLAKAWQEQQIQVEKIPTILDIIGDWKGLVKSVWRLPRLLGFYLNLLFKFKKSGGNLILMSGFSEKLLVSWIASWLNISIVWYEYAPLDSVFTKNLGLPKVLYRLSNNLPVKVLTLSKYTLKALVQSARISKAKLNQIYPGVKLPKLTKPVEDQSYVVGCLARVAREKGQYDLIKQWPEVIKAIPKAKLQIAGDGPDKAELKTLISKLNLAKSVELFGFVDDKENFYKQLDVFVYPGLWELEGFGLVMAEAMSFGIPTIAYDQQPMSEVVGDAGILVNPQKTNGLADSIIKLLQNPKQRFELQKRSLIRTQKYFDLTKQIQMIYQQLQEVVNLAESKK